MSQDSRVHIASIVSAILIFVAGSEAYAMWARLSDAELVDTSTLIVVGKLSQVTVPSEEQGYTLGVIEIADVLKGDRTTRSVWLDVPQPGTPISSSDIYFNVGQEGLWFLRLLAPESDKIYAADHPQRFVPADQAGPQIDMVRDLLER